MNEHKADVEKAVERLSGAKRGGLFSPYIDFIQFPKYRNFQKDLRVTFSFPLTVVVGQNGTGKSSLLQALYGAPANLTPGQWWFGTALDPTSEEEIAIGRQRLKPEDKGSFWYQYHKDGEMKQAVKMRIRRPGDPDYWEPSRPIKSFGMEIQEGKTRDPVITMDAVYMNFKTQISAFDRCFYFNSPEAIKRVEKSGYWKTILLSAKRRSTRIQDYLRWRSHKLKRVLVEGETVQHWNADFHKPRITLSQEELDEIGFIVGRNYSSGYLVEHRFYETWGMSVMFNTNELSYSDAFAGSGESAVVRLVREVYSSKPGRLLLLDEPETSLHPGAQERLLLFLLRQACEKKLQIVVSTHSPAFVRLLPREAIRVMSLTGNGKVHVAEDVNADEAFYVLGHPAENVTQLIVEDRLTKQLIDAVLETMSESFRSQFITDFRPGGESAIKQDAALFMLEPDVRRKLLFDGDKSETVLRFERSRINIEHTADEIDDLVKKHFGIKIKFRQNSQMSDEQKRELRFAFIDYANDNFRCVPFETPEDAIWSDGRARTLLSIAEVSPESFDEIATSDSAKEKFERLARLTQPTGFDLTGGDIGTIHRLFIKAFCQEGGEIVQKIVALLKEIADGD